jgi:chromosome condensin MukBEF complex kleisin-like MukF subunit
MEQALSCDLSGQWKAAQDSCEASASLAIGKDRLKCGVADAFAAADVQSRLMGLKNTLGIVDEELAVLKRKDSKQAICQPVP